MTPAPIVHVFCGTKAQYTKMAPLLRLMDDRGVDYRLIDSGQHAEFNRTLRPSIGVREPDVMLAATAARTLPQGLRWLALLLARMRSRATLRTEVFGGHDGICLVHGDTASTLAGALLARRAGVAVAHVEAGLRSGSIANPFPEEAIRIVVPRLSRLLFPPDPTATENLRRMRIRGRVVETSGNTVVEVLHEALGTPDTPAGQGPVLMQVHRMENLHRRDRLRRFVELVVRVADEHPVRFVMHGATASLFERRGHLDRLRDTGVEVSGLLPSYREFVRVLYDARFVITDGASLQEECAALGVPTLLWRARTERPDGLGRNVVLSRYEPALVDDFLSDPQRLRHPTGTLQVRPSEQILEAVLGELERHS